MAGGPGRCSARRNYCEGVGTGQEPLVAQWGSGFLAPCLGAAQHLQQGTRGHWIARRVHSTPEPQVVKRMDVLGKPLRPLWEGAGVAPFPVRRPQSGAQCLVLSIPVPGSLLEATL